MISVTLKEEKRVKKEISKMERHGEQAVKRTVSDFTSRGPGWISKGIRTHYGVDTAAIKKAGPAKRKNVKQSGSEGRVIDAIGLVYRGGMLTPTHFAMSPKKIPSKRARKKIRIPGELITGSPDVAMISPPARYKVTAKIIKGRRMILSRDAFIATGKGGRQLAFRRKGPRRMPIETIKTISVPQMISGERASGTINEMVNENVKKRFEYQVGRAFK